MPDEEFDFVEWLKEDGIEFRDLSPEDLEKEMRAHGWRGEIVNFSTEGGKITVTKSKVDLTDQGEVNG